MRKWVKKSTAASRAWLGVALVGLLVVALVVALSLVSRLGSGQQVIDAAEPAFTDERVMGTRAGVDLLSDYVDLVDPLLTARGGGNTEVRSLVRLIGRELGLSSAQARKILRREAPHTEALTRALPLSGLADEIPRLTNYLATTLNTNEDELAAILEQRFPRIATLLTTLPNVTDAWYDVPGIEGLTRLSGDKPVRTIPGLRKYLRDDLVALSVERKDEFQSLASRGGIGYIPYLLLAIGVGLFAYGILQSRRAAVTAPGRLSWGIVVVVGVFLVALVVAGQFFGRLSAGQKLVTDMQPVFAQERVRGLTTGYDTVHETIELGDPIMTTRGGAVRETPRLYRFIADRTGRRAGDVRRTLSRRVPRTIALLDALPLATVGNEAPKLVAYLAKAFRISRTRLVSRLRRRAPGLARALLAAPVVTDGWNAVPGTGEMTRFDGVTPVRTLPAFDAYLSQDVLPVFAEEREHFEALTGEPPLDTLAPVLLISGLFVMLYGGTMMVLVARPRRR